ESKPRRSLGTENTLRPSEAKRGPVHVRPDLRPHRTPRPTFAIEIDTLVPTSGSTPTVSTDATAPPTLSLQTVAPIEAVALVCPPPDLVGCTSPDPSNPVDECDAEGAPRNGGRAPEETQAQARDGGDDPARADLRADAPPRHAGADARADLRADHLLGQRRRRDAVPHAGSCAGCEADPQRAPDRVLGLSAVSRRGRDTPPDPPAGHPFPDHGLPDDPGADRWSDRPAHVRFHPDRQHGSDRSSDGARARAEGVTDPTAFGHEMTTTPSALLYMPAVPQTRVAVSAEPMPCTKMQNTNFVYILIYLGYNTAVCILVILSL
ncbi:hypothetical protein THAOC_10784, partial [Thalassiosira oceanica]